MTSLEGKDGARTGHGGEEEHRDLRAAVQLFTL
jgi:hypothetical protein